ncbi:MAG: outer membrane lipoprotein carrier protein LolA [Acidobacteria bacterium]|nr:outer membrane lipoprotein carrier protein LolA [Acidobacteriota bacterium]
MRLSLVFLLLWVAAASVSTLLATSSADELIKQVQDRYNGARTLSVQFEEDYSIQGHPRPSESGTMILKKQGKMRWDYTRPPGKLFLSDGKNVYLYTASDNRVEKVPLKDTEDMRAPLVFLLGHLDMKKDFRDFQVTSAEHGNWLDASASSDRVPYDKVAMLILPNGAIRELKVYGRDQSVMSFFFREEKVNPPVQDQLFHFAIPPGAEVVDAMDSGSQEQ